MRHLASFFAALFFAVAPLSSAVAADAPARSAGTVKPAAKRSPAKSAGASMRLKPRLVAPGSDILHEHYAVSVSGTISDSDGQALPGAAIWKTNSREILAVTNSQGEFNLTLPSNARITLTCGYAGFEDQQLLLSQPQRSNTFVISLERRK